MHITIEIGRWTFEMSTYRREPPPKARLPKPRRKKSVPDNVVRLPLFEGGEPAAPPLIDLRGNVIDPDTGEFLGHVTDPVPDSDEVASTRT